MKVLRGRSAKSRATYMLANTCVCFRKCYRQCYKFDFKLWVTTTDFFPLICTLALGLSSVNFVRVAADTSVFGVQYLLIYSVLCLLLGLPVVLLELGLGQFCQQGAAAVWRAVPALRGVGFVKLMCAVVYALLTSVQAALTSAYAVRSGAANLPMSECSQLTMTQHGYFQNNTFGLECAMRTFLKPFNVDSFWFSVMCIIIFIIWIVIPVCIYCLETSLKYSLCILALVISVLCVTLSIATGQNNLPQIFDDLRWGDVGSSRLWFAAVWQVLLSSRLGLAYLDSVGGTVYFRSHSVRWSVSIVILNLILSWFGVLFWFSISPGIARDTSILSIPLWVYDAAVLNGRHRVWPCLTFVVLLFSTFATMITLLYPVFNSLSKSFKYQWRLSALVLVVAAMISSMALFLAGLDTLTFLERLAVPLAVCLIVFVEITVFFFIYGWRNVRSDLEFMLGNEICVAWVGWWPLSAILILGVATWELYSVVEGGWNWNNLELSLLIAMASIIIITVFIWAVLVIVKQEEYNSLLKIKSSFNPSRKWGPVEPILRHLWIQWSASAHAHSPEMLTQIRAHRQSVTATMLHDTTRSDSSASRKSSLDEYDSRKSSFEDYAGSKKSSENNSSKKSSLEEIGSYKSPSLEMVHGRSSKLSSDKISNLSSRITSLGEVPVNGRSGGEKKTAPSVQENVYYGQIRQMYY